MEPLPRGANFQRTKLLWEIGLHIAGDPKTPYYGPRDMCISVGSGSAENFKPKLRMSTGSPILAHAVCRGDLEMSMVNPSGFLTQAYRGTGLFPQPLPVRILANYPSWDRYVHLIHPRTGLEIAGRDQRTRSIRCGSPSAKMLPIRPGSCWTKRWRYTASLWPISNPGAAASNSTAGRATSGA